MTPSRYVVDATRSDARWAALLAGLALAQEVFRSRGALYHLLVLRDAHWAWWSAMEALAAFVVALAFGGAVARMLDRRENVVLDVRGVLVRDHSDEIIPWSAIARIRPQGNDQVWLTLHDPSRYPSRAWRRWFTWRRRQDADVVIAVPGKEERREELIAAFNAWRPSLVRGL